MGKKGSDPDDLGMNLRRDDRGEALVGYALLVVLIGIGGIVAIREVGSSTSGTFETVSESFGSPVTTAPTTTTTTTLTPDQKWAKAQSDRDAAVADAKARRDAAIAAANAKRDAQLNANKSLPKADRPAANQAANNTRNAEVATANGDYQTSVAAANAAEAAAKAEWQASKKK
jgi:Flp pilus assembly pilin Flp